MRTEYSRIKSFMAKNAVRKSEDELKEESEALFLKRIEQEDKLIEAYKAKKVKSKSAMRRARAIIANREAAAKKAREKKENK